MVGLCCQYMAELSCKAVHWQSLAKQQDVQGVASGGLRPQPHLCEQWSSLIEELMALESRPTKSSM